jgi:hypothetical protein
VSRAYERPIAHRGEASSITAKKLIGKVKGLDRSMRQRDEKMTRSFVIFRPMTNFSINRHFFLFYHWLATGGTHSATQLKRRSATYRSSTKKVSGPRPAPGRRNFETPRIFRGLLTLTASPENSGEDAPKKKPPVFRRFFQSKCKLLRNRTSHQTARNAEFHSRACRYHRRVHKWNPALRSYRIHSHSN